ncbi:MAG TPA: hypothetical protein ENH39_07865, partial [Gammaproteobacteria bacterium]|nr:hypothetical protein [Gammaproteobacteria bacterium]
MTSMEESTSKVKSDDIISFLEVTWRRKWILIITVFSITSIAVGVTLLFSTKQYQSTTDLLQRRSGLDEMILGTALFQETYPDRELETTADLVMSPQVIDDVTASLGDRVKDISVASMTQVNTTRMSNIVKITSTSPDPQLAADVANSFATSYIDWRREVDQGVLQQARQSIEAELRSIPESQQGSSRYQNLNKQLETIESMEVLQTGNLEIVKPATASSTPSSPQPIRTGFIAFLISIIIGVGLMFLIERLDTSVRDTDEVSESLEKPILSIVPKIPSVNNGQLLTISKPSSIYSEAFRLLNTNIGYINPDNKAKSILISSSHANEGK